MKSKKAQSMGIAVVIAITLFIIGMTVVNILKPEVTSARSSTGLNCTGDISDGTKLTCLAVDLVIPYFIIIIISAAGGLITARLVL